MVPSAMVANTDPSVKLIVYAMLFPVLNRNIYYLKIILYVIMTSNFINVVTLYYQCFYAGDIISTHVITCSSQQ